MKNNGGCIGSARPVSAGIRFFEPRVKTTAGKISVINTSRAAVKRARESTAEETAMPQQTVLPVSRSIEHGGIV